VSKLDDAQNKLALACLRLAAQCRGLATDAPMPHLRAHFLRMAGKWAELADQPLIGTKRLDS
jgi:hypothetical protein